MIQSELQMLAASFLYGVGIIISYGFVDLLRTVFLLRKSAKITSEFVYWSAAAVVAFGIQFRLNNGVIRLYSVLGTALGLWVAYRLTEKIYVVLSVKAVRVARKRRKRRKKRKEAAQNRLKKYFEQVKILLESEKEQHEEAEKES